MWSLQQQGDKQSNPLFQASSLGLAQASFLSGGSHSTGCLLNFALHSLTVLSKLSEFFVLTKSSN